MNIVHLKVGGHLDQVESMSEKRDCLLKFSPDAE
jgi:hypothetical protein